MKESSSNMINKKIADIDIEEIKLLLSNSVPESKTLDYKRDLALNTRDEKIKFLADVSAFANTSGGDLVYGVAEEKGVPKEINGMVLPDPDAEILRVENIVRDGLEPRVAIDPHPVLLGGSKYVLVVRVAKSFVAPHRVIFDNHDRFYSRASRNNYQLDVEGLRAAFNQSEGTINKIANLRASRVSEIESDHLPLPFIPGGKMVLHVFPLDPHFISAADISKIMPSDVSYAHNTVSSHLTNFDGKLFYSLLGNNAAYFYVQLFRDGAFELVHSLSPNDRPNKFYPELAESVLRFGVKHLQGLSERLGFAGPFVVFISFTNVLGYSVAGERLFGLSTVPIDRDVLLFPDIVLDAGDAAFDPKIKPVFDLIWSAVGVPQSPNFDAAGNWKIGAH